MPNPPIAYDPTFQHQDWVDNVDRVQAAGDNGFNIRFHALEAEFKALHGIIAEVNAALDALGAKPPAQTLSISTVPVLTPTAAAGTSWGALQGVAMKPPGQLSAHGMMPLSLPHGDTLKTFRVVGHNSGNGSLRIALFRQGLGDAPPQRIALVTGTTDPFDVSSAADAAMVAIDTTQFKYYIMADLDNAGANDNVQLTGFQVTYSTS